MLRNPGFEQEKTGTTAASGWVSANNNAFTETRADRAPHSGRYYGCHWGSTAYTTTSIQTVTNLPNGSYTLRAWVKSTGGQTSVLMLARNFGGTQRQIPIPTTYEWGNWTQIELTNIAVTAGKCEVGFSSNAGTNQWIYFDDIELVKQNDSSQPTYVTRTTYGGDGAVLATESIDEGRTEYVYARDGRIRFSQSALQRANGRFSYSNYDGFGRVVESGEYTMATDRTQGKLFENQLPQVFAHEAEAAGTKNATVATANVGYRSTGYLTGLTATGKYASVSTASLAAGTYPVHVRYATSTTSGYQVLSLYVNNVFVSKVQFPATSSLTGWETTTLSLNLSSGVNTIKLQVDNGDTGGVNLDYLELHRERIAAANSVLALVEDRTASGGLDVGRCSQRNQVWYDEPVLVNGQADPKLNGRQQDFLLGGVAKTTNGTSTTWYSYDELGRLIWMVQDAPTMGTKTVDYTYDLLGNVLEVAYQKGQPDAFYHHYEYDADKRLRSVYTSPDGLAQNRTLQARYFYYLHGPLKRVEVADRLQGIDYTYTVQGWLKAINNAEKRLDPGKDNPTTNGTLKDLFGLRLDYFNGDYASRQLTAPNLSSPANQNQTFYAGLVRASSWHTAAAPNVHGYAYQYDAKGQLLESDYGTLTAGTTLSQEATRKFSEGNLNYDAHGNILSLRRRDGAGLATDDFTYQYAANTNKLTRTVNGAGNPVLSYEYDESGQMTRETEAGKTDRFLSYDVAGKVTGVYTNAARTTPLALYTYDDRGYRRSKAVYAAGVLQNTTYYVTDAQGNVLSTYEQAAGQALQLTEVPLYGASRVGTITRVEDNTLEPRYELNDQLGNARVVFRRPKTKTFQATMETAQASQEEADFTNVAATRFAFSPNRPGSTGTSVSRLVAAQGVTTGPAKILDVQKGDTVSFSAWVRFSVPTCPTCGNRSAILAAATVTTGTVGNGLSRGARETLRHPGKASQLLSRVGVGLTFTGLSKLLQPTKPTAGVLAWLHYRLKDEQGNTVSDQYEPFVGTQADVWQQLKLGVRLPQTGKLELSVESNDPTRTVYFDDVVLEHTNSTIVQEQHQYAFGTPITGLSYAVGTKKYRHGYQGQYADKDDETGYDAFELRLYNSRIGRWTSYDPEGQFHSPYVGMGNNPVSGVDIDGGWSWVGSAGGALIGAGIGMAMDRSGSKWDGAAKGAAIGFLAGGVLGPDVERHGSTKADNIDYDISWNIPKINIPDVNIEVSFRMLTPLKEFDTQEPTPPISYNRVVTSPYTESIRIINTANFKKSASHPALDIRAKAGTPIRSPWSGVVSQAETADYGQFVIINHTTRYHGRKITTSYSHLSRTVVKQGQKVSQGQIIGYTGKYGTGPHLHFKVRVDGKTINPLSIFPFGL
ncbi:peptidoglycan DD-metalloendopeptidase family protein [Hymenobacter sp. J193]|uniref:peptidoglycan DD-metalloendopeptidase family protein n=1 Tax=Hymenobacter sp. J193 TaxID=2898429 RepID=UPI002151B449|nr:peptidoglycan DD-metalloendopeptidase family protein [Hymenobacter sp. J193]MCR5886648.1 peptidoglycan DD-metalloendopeptidase family protein [Hymenobacter sp. J193]